MEISEVIGILPKLTDIVHNIRRQAIQAFKNFHPNSEVLGGTWKMILLILLIATFELDTTCDKSWSFPKLCMSILKDA